jgi:hypothetical protein
MQPKRKAWSKPCAALLAGALGLLSPAAQAANHREAPITAIDQKADITDVYAFVSYDDPDSVTMIMTVDPFQEPSNGPNYAPFDPALLYQIKIDNDNDAVEDITYQFRFSSQLRLPEVFTAFVGAGDGLSHPAGAPKDLSGQVPTGLLVPPAVTSLSSPGLGYRQRYTVTRVLGQGASARRSVISGRRALFAVPSNAGPRTMPNYEALVNQGTYLLASGIRVYTGSADDAFWLDLGATFDSLNFRSLSALPGGLLTPEQDADDTQNFNSDDFSGFNVNAIAIQVPIAQLTRTGRKEPPDSRAATLGIWATTSRPRVTTLGRPGAPATYSRDHMQIQRMGNPLINEVIIGTGAKDRFSQSQPKGDVQFARFALDPLLARLINALYSVPVPDAPRTDLLPLVTYAPPIAAEGTPPGPVADLLRLNTGVPPTPRDQIKRLGLLAGDPAGFPNGRRLEDDVTDIALRAVGGVLAGSQFNYPIGDGVNRNDVPYRAVFPYLGLSNSGLESRHVDAGEPGCSQGNCPP